MEVLFHIFYYYWGEEYRLLYRGLRYIEVRYIESEKHNRQLAFELQNSHVCEKRSKGAMSSYLLSS